MCERKLVVGVLIVFSLGLDLVKVLSLELRFEPGCKIKIYVSEIMC